MVFVLYDTLTREKLPVFAGDGQVFRFYCCGPTVYGPAHIGNFRTYVLQDVFRRTVEANGLATRHVRNITDVDDKTIRESSIKGESLGEFTRRWTERFQRDAARLNLLPPHVEPAATDHIPEQIELIQRLMEKDAAYVGGDGSVYFRTSAFPEYGKLAHLDLSTLRTQQSTSGGGLNLADEYGRDTVADFALWKKHKPEDGPNSWDSPWGPGRPGWHLECSAMSMRYLGTDFDLHSGGVDLIFPHHENEIAQSEAATGERFARHWFHPAHLMVEGRKMSKSLGNLYTLDEIEARGYSPMVLRYLLLSGHYRQSFNFTEAGLVAAASALRKLDRMVTTLLDQVDPSARRVLLSPEPYARNLRIEEAHWLRSFWEALCDDLNTPAALGALFSVLGRPLPDDVTPAVALAELAFVSQTLGLIWFATGSTDADGDEAPAEVSDLAEERWKAKAERDFARADALRVRIEAAGWSVLDTREGYSLTPLK